MEKTDELALELATYFHAVNVSQDGSIHFDVGGEAASPTATDEYVKYFDLKGRLTQCISEDEKVQVRMDDDDA